MPIDGIEPARINLLQVANSRCQVIPKVVHHTFNRPTVKEMPVSVRQLELEDPPETSASNGVSKGKREHANNRRKPVTKN